MSLQNPISPDEQTLLEGALDVLFACQGKNLNKDIRSIWITEIDKATVPTKAVLQALAFLKTEELQAIKLNVVFAAARRYMAFEPAKDCGDCHGGYVIMRDEQGRSFSLKCKCQAGHSKINQGLVDWAGLDAQYSNGRELVKV